MTDTIKIEGKRGTYTVLAEDTTTGVLTLKREKSCLEKFSEGLCPELTQEQRDRKVFSHAIEVAARTYRKENGVRNSDASTLVQALKEARG